MSLPLPLPKSRAHIAHIQSERKKNAFALAKTVPWYRDKLAGIDADALDDPAEWQKIPILDKDTLRKFSHAELLGRARSGRAAPKCSAWGWFGSEPAIPIRQLHNSS